MNPYITTKSDENQQYNNDPESRKSLQNFKNIYVDSSPVITNDEVLCLKSLCRRRCVKNKRADDLHFLSNLTIPRDGKRQLLLVLKTSLLTNQIELPSPDRKNRSGCSQNSNGIHIISIYAAGVLAVARPAKMRLLLVSGS